MEPAPPVYAQGVRFSYSSPGISRLTAPVFTDLAFSVQPGECVALMGANGAGKTTLCRLVSALAPHLTGGELSGQLQVLGHDVAQIHPAALAGQVGVTFQEVEYQLFNATVEAEVAWGLEALGLAPAEIDRRIAWALDVVGLEVGLSRSPASLSGGQQRRLALAVALAIRPQLLVLDEPLGGLDPAGTKEVLVALAALRRETSAAILITESVPEAALTLADRVAVLSHGQVALEGSPSDVFSHTDLLDQLGVAVPELVRLAAELRSRTSGAFFFEPDGAERELAPLVRTGPGMSSPAVRPFPAARAAELPAVHFERVSFHYPGGPRVLHDLDLTVSSGEWIALVGANGSGKTTLAKQTNGLLRPTAGRVWVRGEDAARLSVGQLAQQVGYLFQHPERQIFASTVWDEVAFGPRNLSEVAHKRSGVEPDGVQARVEAALDRFHLTDLAASPPAVLSYALRRLVTLASVAAMEPAILVLDEPTVGLDARGRAVTLDWCRELHAGGQTVLLITHDMSAAAQADRLVVLDAGRVIGDGPPSDVFSQPELLARASLEPPPVSVLAQRLGLPPDILDVPSFLGWLAVNSSGPDDPTAQPPYGEIPS